VATRVSQLADAEYQLLRIDDPAGQAEAHGITLLRFPLADMGIPEPQAAGSFAALIRGITARLQAGSSVVVHCRAGKGRSGLVAAAVLAAFGQPPSSAIGSVRRARPGAVETAAQEQSLHEFAGLLALQDGRRS
jgi:protein-tyrosine phosphatase